MYQWLKNRIFGSRKIVAMLFLPYSMLCFALGGMMPCYAQQIKTISSDKGVLDSSGVTSRQEETPKGQVSTNSSDKTKVTGDKKRQKFAYVVKIDAPLEIKKMLQENLNLFRWQNDIEMNDRQLRRMYRSTPSEVHDLMETEGYYAPEVKTELQGEIGNRTVIVHVDPGKPVKVATVNLIFEGDVLTHKTDKATPDVQGLKKGWQLPIGSIFRMQDWEAAKLALLNAVTKARFPRAKILNTQAVVDPVSHEAHLTVEIDSGRAVRFGDVVIIGLRRYSERVIRAQHPPKKGSAYSEQRLQRFQSRLLDIGYFNGVEVIADLETGADDIPIIVKVHENYFSHASVGVGYSTDTRERVSLNYENFSFIGQDWHLKSSAVIQNKQQTVKADIYLPENEEGFRDSFGVAYDRSDFRGLDTRTVGLNVRRAWGTPRFEQYVMLEYLNEHERIKGDHDEKPEAFPLTYGLIKRRVNNIFSPTEGYIVEAQVGGAVKGLVTDETFVRGHLKGKLFHEVGSRGDIIVRGELGAVLSDTKAGVPSTVMFRTGGDHSVRGYSYQSLGVRRGDAIFGGRYLAAGSIEYQHYFWDDWGLAFFVDAGNVTDKWAKMDYAVGYGTGIRWKSPAGPIGVDLAYGQKTGNVHLHFSFGLTF